jgi:hypothetical protein
LAQTVKSADPDIERALTLIALTRAQRQGVASNPGKTR